MTEQPFLASHRISFTDEQQAYILEETQKILASGQVVLGKYTAEFEKEYAEACGREHGVAVASDTAAFELQLRIIAGEGGDLKGKYVLFPALAFPSILQSIVNAGGQPWYFDGAWDGHLFARLEQVQEAVAECKKATGQVPVAIILMHTGGLIARDSKEITEWCEAQGIEVLEDAAHSYGAVLDGAPAGSFGLASAFSLYATKPMHACEGGVIVTDDENFANECKIYRNYGRTQDFGRSIIIRHGYSWRMTEIQAVIGLANLRGIEPNIARRREIMQHYDDALSATGGVWQDVPKLAQSDGMEPNGYRYIRILPEGWDHAKRLEFKNRVKAEHGIDLPGEVYELPCHKQPIWSEYKDLSMPMAEDFCNRHFALPVYQTLTGDDLVRIVEATTKVLTDMV